MSAACNGTHSVWLCVSGYCLKSVSLISVVISLQVSCAGVKSTEVSFE